jgi:hexosaminidase
MGINYSKALFELEMKMEKDEQGRGVRVNLSSDFPNTSIFYTLDGSAPGPNTNKIEGSVLITQTTKLKAGLYLNNLLQGKIFEQQYYINKACGKKITLTTDPSPNYNNGGAFTLVDGILGVMPWYGKEWLGFSGTDMEALIDLGKIETVSRVTVDVLSDENSWIHLPKSVQVAVSMDGQTFTAMKTITRGDIMDMGRNMVLQFDAVQTRYIKVKAENRGKIPEGYNGAGEPAWLFVDEIGVE